MSDTIQVFRIGFADPDDPIVMLLEMPLIDRDLIVDDETLNREFGGDLAAYLRWLTSEEGALSILDIWDQDRSVIIAGIKCNPVEMIDDVPILPTPEFCQQWPCCNERKPLENRDGFLVCPVCKRSYGKMKEVPKSGD